MVKDGLQAIQIIPFWSFFLFRDELGPYFPTKD